MRATHLAAVAAVVGFSPAMGGTVIQTLPAVQTLGDFTPFDIRGAQFDPTLGPLVSGTGEPAGSETTSDFRFPPPFSPTTLVTRWTVFTPDGVSANAFGGTLPNHTVGASVTGAEESSPERLSRST